MGQYTPPTEDCANCGARFSWLFVDSIHEGDIYECEKCNNIILKVFEVIEDDN
jgi:DNA-directed RNA polymerase subunit RPC12/RpoP